MAPQLNKLAKKMTMQRRWIHKIIFVTYADDSWRSGHLKDAGSSPADIKKKSINFDLCIHINNNVTL